MPTRRQFLRSAGATAAVASGAAVLPGLTTTAFAQTLPPSGDVSARRAAYAAELAHQSPIDIVAHDVIPAPNANPLVIDYPTNIDLEMEYITKDTAGNPAGCTIRQFDEVIEGAHFSAPASVTIGGEAYDLLQFHFHIRSEHTLDGVRFAMEQHFVHSRVSDGQIMVIGVWLTRGGSHTQQDKVLAQLPVECDEPVHVSGVNLRAMLPAGLQSFLYSGSLTTPDYTEGVRWHVMRERKAISGATVDRMHAMFPDGDARATQPLNDRRVFLVPGRLA